MRGVSSLEQRGTGEGGGEEEEWISPRRVEPTLDTGC